MYIHIANCHYTNGMAVYVCKPLTDQSENILQSHGIKPGTVLFIYVYTYLTKGCMYTITALLELYA